MNDNKTKMKKMSDYIKRYRWIPTVALALAGIGLMAYYNHCDTACSYLRGDIFGLDLKWVGIAFMAVLILLTALGQTGLVRACLAGGLGVEVYLYSFQIQNDIYCPFCLAFSAMVILMFIINYELPSAWRENRRRLWLYFLGEADLPLVKIRSFPLLVAAILGYLFVVLSFSGSAIPAYGQEKTGDIPSLGKGTCEIVIFSDYFCRPCRMLDTGVEGNLKDLLTTGKVKIIFADLPSTRLSPMYARYYLYGVNATGDAESVLRLRRSLFEAAQIKRLASEAALIEYLKEMNLAWKKMDEKPVFAKLNTLMAENGIDATPTCVIRYSPAQTKKFVGVDDAQNALADLKMRLK